MNIRDNVRLNRTKMLDEAALNHRPSHFMNTFLIFLLVYFISSLAQTLIAAIPTALYLISNDDFFLTFFKFSSGEISEEAFLDIYTKIIENTPWWVTCITLFASGALIAGAIIYCKFFEKRSIASLGIRRSNIGLEYGLGAMIGLVMYALTVLIAYLCGSVTIDISSKMSLAIIPFLLAFIVQGAGEEIFVRGYFMTSVARDYKVVLAVVFSSAVFSILHGANAGASLIALINVFLFGIFEAIYILKRGDIWGACAIHSLWNFAQGNIFGSNVSGMIKMPSILELTANPDMTNANGGSFGLEGGFACTIVIIVAIGILLLVKPKQSELPEYELNREFYSSNSFDSQSY